MPRNIMASDDFQFDEVFEHNSQELEDPNLDTDQLEDDEDPYSGALSYLLFGLPSCPSHAPF